MVMTIKIVTITPMIIRFAVVTIAIVSMMPRSQFVRSSRTLWTAGCGSSQTRPPTPKSDKRRSRSTAAAADGEEEED